MTLGQRAVTAVGWNVLANITRIVVAFARGIILARLLAIADFGQYAGAAAITGITLALPAFGMGGAFLHRAPESMDEEAAAATHLSLKIVFTLIWAAVMMVVARFVVDDTQRPLLLALIIIRGLIELTQTPQLILTRRVIHRRLVLIQLVTLLVATPASLLLAWRGAGPWSLVAIDASEFVVSAVLLYVWRPPWRARLELDRARARYYLSFGSRHLVGVFLAQALDRVDDLWTQFVLGARALGFYSQAYKFATYPRYIVARPLSGVISGAFAELKDDREGLSRVFFRSTALLIRSGFALGVMLFLIAPEFIRLGPGPKWLPMLTTFRLMLVFTLLDPLKGTIAHVFIANGRPQALIRVRLIQLAVLIASLQLLGPAFGFEGVAVAVNLMLVTGMALLFHNVRAHVDFSLRRLFTVPIVALVLSLALTALVLLVVPKNLSDWSTGALKLLVSGAAYGLVLLILERDELRRMGGLLRQTRAPY